jgi:8-oxo-dGTP pyrophosphatase MutT (NUDIX family)
VSPACFIEALILSGVGAKMPAWNRVWKPNVTVAALIEREGRFLLVEEETGDGIRFNQPAGHLDQGESLVAACAREALEETAWQLPPDGAGRRLPVAPAGRRYHLPALRLCGELGEHEAEGARWTRASCARSG